MPWCQEIGVHRRHERVLITIHGNVPGLRQAKTLQLIVFSNGDGEVRPALILIDPRTLAQQSVEFAWSGLMQLAVEIELGYGRFRES